MVSKSSKARSSAKKISKPRDSKPRGTRQQRADTAFEAYWKLGEDRSLDRLAREPKMPSLGTLRNYSKDFHWQDRLLERQEKIAEQVDRETALLEARFITNQKKFLMNRLARYHRDNIKQPLESRTAYLDMAYLLNQLRRREEKEVPTEITVLCNIPGE